MVVLRTFFPTTQQLRITSFTTPSAAAKRKNRWNGETN